MRKLNLVLDLDNTLISSISFLEMKSLKNIKKRKLTYKIMTNYYNVYYRPYLDKFLDYAFKNFHITIWTAASRDYATFIIDNIILGDKKHTRKIKMLLYDKNCEQSQQLYNSKSPKDLRYLYNFEGYHPCDTIIMDDLPEVYNANPRQTIRAIYFDAKKNNSENDIFLLRAKDELEKIRKNYNENGCTVHNH